MSRLRVGLALSGGTAKSVLHVGVLRALAEAGIRVDYIAGTSGGSIVATAFAAGLTLAQMEDFATSMSWWKLARIKLSRLGFVSSKPIEDFMAATLPVQSFEELAIPCAVPVTDLVTGRKVVYTHGSIPRVVRASCSIPQIYQPVVIDDGHFVDGGLSEYLPVQSVRDLGDQFTIAVNLNQRREKYERPRNILALIMQITNMIARQNVAISVQHADFLIHPDIDRYSSFDFRSSQELVELGYFYTQQRIDALTAAMRNERRPLRRFRRWLQPQRQA